MCRCRYSIIKFYNCLICNVFDVMISMMFVQPLKLEYKENTNKIKQTNRNHFAFLCNTSCIIAIKSIILLCYYTKQANGLREISEITSKQLLKINKMIENIFYCKVLFLSCYTATSDLKSLSVE